MLGVKKSKKFLKHLKDFTHPQDNAVKVKCAVKVKGYNSSVSQIIRWFHLTTKL